MRDYSDLLVSLRCCISDSEPCEHCNCELEECNPKIIMEIAADAIEELLKENAELENSGRVLMAAFARLKEKVPKWISVEERLPEIGKFVLVSDGDDIDAACRYKAFTIPDEIETFFWDSVLEVTHWMPLPSTEELKEV